MYSTIKLFPGKRFISNKNVACGEYRSEKMGHRAIIKTIIATQEALTRTNKRR